MSAHPRDLAGRGLMISFPGPTLTPATAELLARTRAAGVVLFAGNIRGPAQLAELCAALQAEAAALGLPPLLIAIDQEGGTVSRLPAPFVVPPSPQALAATGDEQAAYAAARISGLQLRAHGVNMNFAPVLDVNCNPANPVIGTRAFGADATTVARFGLAALGGYRDAGVIAVAKHFPGHGDTTVDSHHGLPVLPHNSARLDALELVPFRAALAAGVPALMSAHVVFSTLDDAPATLSPLVLRGLLRGRLGFDGLIVTDALDMAAIAGRYGAVEAAVLARRAGADIVLPLGDAANQLAVAKGLAAAIEAGRLDAADFMATARRIADLSAVYHLAAPPPAAPDMEALEREAAALARRSLTVSDRAGLLPLPRAAPLAVIDCLQPRWNNAEEATDRSAWLRTRLLERFPAAQYCALLPTDPAEAWARAAASAGGGAATLLITRNAWADERQQGMIAALAATPTSIIHLAARGPQDARLLDAGATLLSYGDPPLSLEAALARIAGEPGEPRPDHRAVR